VVRLAAAWQRAGGGAIGSAKCALVRLVMMHIATHGGQMDVLLKTLYADDALRGLAFWWPRARSASILEPYSAQQEYSS
jgi:hypothetical protein